MMETSELQQRIAALFPRPVLPAGYPTLATAGEPPATPLAESTGEVRRGRRRLWELDAKFHCPLIGSCVPVPELTRLAARFAFVAEAGDAYALHVEAVGRAGERNPFSEALQRHLDQTYAAALQHFAQAKSAAAVADLWQTAFRQGQVAGAFWAVLSHRHATPEVRQQAYRDLHMLSHQVGAGHAADTRRLADADRELARLRQQLADDRRRAQDNESALRAQVQSLSAQNVALHAEAARAHDLQTRLAAFESGQAVTALAQKLMATQDRHDHLTARLARSETHAADLARVTAERDRLATRLTMLERVLNHEADADTAGDCAQCAVCPDAPPNHADPSSRRERCVLCVGGRTPLLPQYRSLAERLGFRLIHHDGGQEEALSRLPALIDAADAVLCPTDCVSHSAYYRLKRQCKRDGKPCVLFRGASVTGFALALTRLATESAAPATTNAASPETA